MEAVNYYKKLADMWRNMDANAMSNHPKVVEPKQIEPIVITEPKVAHEDTPIPSVEPTVQYATKPAKIGFIRRLLAKLF